MTDFSSLGAWFSISASLIGLLAITYGVAWRRLRPTRTFPASGVRLASFMFGILILTAALAWPLPLLADKFISARALQKVMLCMLAPPLLWLGLPFHVIAWALPSHVRRRVRLGPLLRRTTHPLATWLFFVSAFLLWHDPTYVNWSVERVAIQTATGWLLLLSAVLFWWHVVNTGPRLHAPLPGWIMAGYLLTVEIPNMAAGVTIAFTMHPIYTAYFEVQQTLPNAPYPYMTDQMIGGAVIWVFGSLLYISAIIGVFYQLFRREDSNTPYALAGWDEGEKAIAPGLEHRVHQNRWRETNANRG